MSMKDCIAHCRALGQWLVIVLITLPVALMPAVALADEWIAEQLRGRVFVQIDREWHRIERGDSVSDMTPIRSIASGRATFVRGRESVEIAGDTIIRIHDHVGSNTRVEQVSGSVTVEAERRDVQHFEVETPYLAAVVKGTRFTVTVGNQSSSVDVETGTVQVRDQANRMFTDISEGQSADVRPGRAMRVEGDGPRGAFVTFEGEEITPEAAEARVAGRASVASSSANGNDRGNSGSAGPPADLPTNAAANGNGNGTPAHAGNSNGSPGNPGNGNGPPAHVGNGSGPPAHAGNGNGLPDNPGNGNGRGNGNDRGNR